jgi:hypothetical protein
MLWATVAGLSSLAVPSLAGWVAWPARLTLDYIVGTIQSLAAVPDAAVNQPITWWQMAGFYGLLTTIMFILWRKNGKITEMKVESMRGEA